MSDIRICVATPVYGDPESASVRVPYAGTIYALGDQLDALVGDESWVGGKVILEPYKSLTTDIVHARSEYARKFLESPKNYTHILWWDEDVCPADKNPQQIAVCIRAMLQSGHELVCVPYPQKRMDFQHAAREIRKRLGMIETVEGEFIQIREFEENELPTPEQLEAWATPHYAFNFLQSKLSELDIYQCAEVDWAPIGFSLWQRSVVEKMVEAYRDTLSYRTARYDDSGNLVLDDKPTVALFMLEQVQGKELHHEDFSFCSRWRKIGGKLHLYLGDGSPLSHIGTHTFRGSRLAWK